MSFLKTRYADAFYVIFRIGAGLLFFMLGIQKLFGLWGMPGGAAAFGTLVWFAGAGELLIGLSLITGVFVRLASIFGVIEMIVAYYLGHVAPAGIWNPTINMGMPALLYLLIFLVTYAYGAKKASLEHTVFGREIF